MDIARYKTLLIIAALNEQDAIGPTLNEVHQYLKEFYCLVVDGHSFDQTVDVAKSNGANVILQKGLGKGDAIATALDYSRGENVEFIGMIDGDFTYPAKYFPLMTRILEKNPDIGMVCGNRFSCIESKAMGSQFFLGNRLLCFVHKLVNGVNLEDPLTGLRVIRREILDDWLPRSKGFDIEVELNHHVQNKGFKIVEIPITYRRRIGEKKLRIIHGFHILKRIIVQKLANSSRKNVNLNFSQKDKVKISAKNL